VSFERDYRREFLERWVVLNVAYVIAFWLSITLLLDNSLVRNHIFEEKGAFIVRALFLHFFPFNVMYVLASAYCHHLPASRWHEHRVFVLILLIAGVLWGIFLPGEIVSHW